MQTCVFCNATNNLNTTMTITVNDSKVNVYVCDTHAEDATVKTVKEAYTTKQQQIDELLKQAQALGLNVSTLTKADGVLIPTINKKAAQPEEIQLIDDESLEGAIPTERIDNKTGRMSVGGETSMGVVQSHTSHDLDSLESRLPQDVRKGKAKIALVEGREGIPIQIPELRVDGTGTTKVKIIKKEDDRTLQHRFKVMADRSIHNSDDPHLAREGYNEKHKTCPICRGTGACKQVIAGKVTTTRCPKCDGLGTITI